MKKSLLMLTLLILISNLLAITSTTAGGIWGDPDTWVNGIVPQSTDDVVINGHVTINYFHYCGTLTINNGKSITGTGVMNVTSDFINLGTYINTSTTNIGGNLVQGGMTWQSGTITFTRLYDQEITTTFPLDCSGSFHCGYAANKKIILHGNLKLKNTGFYLDGSQLVADNNAEINIENGYLYGGDNDIIDINQSVIYNFKNAYIGNLTQQGDAIIKGNVSSAGFTIIGNVTVADTLSPFSYGTSGYGGRIVNVTGNLTNNGLIRGNVLPDGSNNMSLTVNVTGNYTNNAILCNNTNSATGVFTNNGIIRNTNTIYVGQTLVNNGSIIDGFTSSNNGNDITIYKTVIVFTGDQSYNFTSTSSAVMQKCRIHFENQYSENPRSFTISGIFNPDSCQFFTTAQNFTYTIAPSAVITFKDCAFEYLNIDAQGNSLNFSGKNIFNVKGLKDCSISGKTYFTSLGPVQIDGDVDFNDSVFVNIYGNGMLTFKVNGVFNNHGTLADNNIYDGFQKSIIFTANGDINNYGSLGNTSVTINKSGEFNNYGMLRELSLSGYSSAASCLKNVGTIGRLNQTQYPGSIVNSGTIAFLQPDYVQLGGHFVNKGVLLNTSTGQYTLTNSQAAGRNQQIILANKKSFPIKIQFSSDFSGRWYKNGVLIPNQTSNSSVFSKDSLTINDIGTYHCYLTSGNLTSRKLIVDTLFKTTAIAPTENQAVSTQGIDFKWLPIPGVNEYRIQLATNPNFTQNTRVINQLYDTTYTLTNLSPNSIWYWRVAARTVYGFTSKEYQWTPYTTVSSFNYSGSGIQDDLSKTTFLAQNYPNPFNPSTSISFSIPKMSKVELAVYNVNGQLVKTLVNSELKAGNHAINFNSTGLNSGVYVYQLKTGNQILTRKMILCK